jgi:sulfur carrier protein ThiS adenylyltransferase
MNSAAKRKTPAPVEMDELLSPQPLEVNRWLRTGSVGIAGAGGLGSVVAENLARAGVGRIVVADHDVVEPSNLNRQRYFLSQIGMFKVTALGRNLKQSNPFLDYVPVREKVTAGNCGRIFESCSVVAECLDLPASKAELVSGLRSSLPHCTVVAASGLAGLDSGNTIRTRKISDRLYLVGDTVSEASMGEGLFAARVGIAASMQALVILRILTGRET